MNEQNLFINMYLHICFLKSLQCIFVPLNCTMSKSFLNSQDYNNYLCLNLNSNIIQNTSL